MTIADCPIRTTIDAIGGKWKTLILYYLKEGPHRFGELLRLLEGATKKVLTAQLRELERDDIVERRVYEALPPQHVEYRLSAYGDSLRPVLQLMCDWGLAHRAREEAQRPAAVQQRGAGSPA
jgi:DNA-binding HxlR family transcriptional regulator